MLSLTILCAIGLAGSIAAQQAADRAAVPDAGAIRNSEKLIKEVFKDDYGKTGLSDRIALAKKLLEQSEATKDDPTSRYVLLREANSLAGLAGDFATALKAAEELGRAYTIDAVGLKFETLQALSKGAKALDDFARIASAYLALSKEASEIDDFAAAEKAAAAASVPAKKAQNVLLVNRATARLKETADLKSRFEKVRKMKETLAANPEDPAANLEIGQYECFTKGNWAVGLPLLAKGSDVALKDLAARDLAGSNAPPDQASVGDGWWDQAEKRPPVARELLRQRAALWYEKAAPNLTGLSRTKTDKRLLELRLEALNRGTWIEVSDPKLYGSSGQTLTLKGGSKATLSKLPDGEFDGLTVRVKIPVGKTTDVSIQYETRSKSIFVYQKSGQVQSAKLEGDTWDSEVMKLCPRQEEYLFTLLIVDGQYVGYVDTREFFRLPTRREFLTPFLFWVCNEGGEASFDQVKLRKRQ